MYSLDYREQVNRFTFSLFELIESTILLLIIGLEKIYQILLQPLNEGI